jgi:hypothetical protein
LHLASGPLALALHLRSYLFCSFLESESSSVHHLFGFLCARFIFCAPHFLVRMSSLVGAGFGGSSCTYPIKALSCGISSPVRLVEWNLNPMYFLLVAF